MTDSLSGYRLHSVYWLCFCCCWLHWQQTEMMLMAASGTDLLLYLLANAIFSLVFTEFERFVKRSVLAYLIHVVILSGLLYLFLGGLPEDAREVLPVYGALIMSFSFRSDW